MLSHERREEARACACVSTISIASRIVRRSTDSMRISSSAHKPQPAAATAAGEGALAPPITLSERSSTGLALLRIFVGYLWFQQLFWKLPPTFAGLYGDVVRESRHA